MILPFTEGLIVTNHFDPEMALLADRHYSRRTIGARQFCYSGRKLVLRNAEGTVLFVWMYPQAEMRMDRREGFNCAIFRNESDRRSSDIIIESERFAVQRWGANRAYTFVNPAKIRSANPGCCFKIAGWTQTGTTKDGKKIVLEKWLS